LTVAAEYKDDLDPDDFEVECVSKTNSSYVRLMNVYKVDNKERLLVTMFGGAFMGKYNIVVRHKTLGLLKNTAGDFDVSSSITGISRSEGSTNGGTLLTITGTNFGKVYTDNPIQISYNGGQGSTDCFHTKTTPTEIKCRLPTDIDKPAGTIGTVVVFNKLASEAECAIPSCKYTLKDPEATIESAITVYDSYLKAHKLILKGKSFGTDKENVELFIDGKKQEVISVGDVLVAFKIVDVNDYKLSNFVVYFPEGVPKGVDVLEKAGLKLTPQFQGMTEELFEGSRG